MISSHEGDHVQQRVFQRAVEFQLDQGGTEAARELISKSVENNVVLSLSSPEGNQMIAEEKTKHEERLARLAVEREQSRAEAEREQGKRGGYEIEKVQRDGGGSGSVDLSLVMNLKPGMSSGQVKSILGLPHKIEETNIPASPFTPDRQLITWTYNPNTESYIVLLFEHDRLDGGGSGGYDIHKGFTAKLPSHLSPAEREKRRKAAEALGIHVEE